MTSWRPGGQAFASQAVANSAANAVALDGNANAASEADAISGRLCGVEQSHALHVFSHAVHGPCKASKAFCPLFDLTALLI